MPRAVDASKREAILDAAIVELARSGFQKTTVAMIARRAGVADGTIYLYFTNKEDVLCSVFERAMDRFIREGQARMADAVSAVEKMRRVVQLHLELVGQDRDLAIITQVELRHSLHVLDQLSRTKVGQYLAILGEIVAQGQAAGEFRRDLDPAFAAKAVFGVLDEMATDWVLSRRNTRLESRGADVAAFLLAALTAGAGPLDGTAS
jgi:TetR/AcrR family fatty acid metabolism transcriptional regulator